MSKHSISNAEGTAEIITSYGADYLKYRRPAPEFKKEDLRTIHGDLIKIGDKVTGFGIKARTEFTLYPGAWMQYEGIYLLGNVEHAIFNCNLHNPDPEADYMFRYAFAIVRDKKTKEVNCFLSGTIGLRDISLKPIHRYEQ